jgi:protein-S-isoprenylcysteine O-methyltransferase Ste14
MFLRALLAFLVLPGLFAFAIPAAILAGTGHTAPVHPAGLIVLALGCIGLLWCVRDFYVAGKGTLAPWSPPVHLVVVGLYRYSRNPMYVAVTTILVGQAITFGSAAVAAYAAVLVVGFHVRVVTGEEPYLERTHGEHWHEYSRRVRRWL